MNNQDMIRIQELIAELHRIVDPAGPAHVWSKILNQLEAFEAGRPEIEAFHRSAREWILLVESLVRRWGIKPHKPGSCPLAFRSPSCGYEGNALWCDKSLSRCIELENDLNFCGLRDEPESDEQPIR